MQKYWTRAQGPSSEIQERLYWAAGIAKTANDFAFTRNTEKAIEIALNVEQLVYEVSTLLNSASLIYRVCKT